MRSFRGIVGNESGAALVLAGVALTGILGMAALAIDVAMVYGARGDAQRAADAAALAGASAFVDANPNSVAGDAVSRAMETAQRNTIRRAVIAPDEVTVVVDEEDATVRVTIRRGQLSTLFARALGVGAVPVSARATARVSEATSASCVKPFAPPEGGGGGGGTGAGRPGGRRNRPGSGTSTGNGGNGYAYGQQMVLKGPSANAESFPWVIPTEAGWEGPCPVHGASHTPPRYEANICNCNRTTVTTGTSYGRVAGWQGGLRQHTSSGVAGLLAQDPNAVWDPGRGEVVGSQHANWRRSPRVVSVPLYDPGSAGSQLTFTRFIKVFLEYEANGTVAGRFVQPIRVVQLTE